MDLAAETGTEYKKLMKNSKVAEKRRAGGLS